MLNAQTNKTAVFILLLFFAAEVFSADLDSIPIAEYCVKYGKKEFQKISCRNDINSAEIHLYLDTILQSRPSIITCSSYYPHSTDSDFKWIVEFLIDKGLEAKGCEDPFGGGLYGGAGGDSGGDRDKYPLVEGAIWYFVDLVPIFAKNKKLSNLSKHYGKNIPVKWQLNSKCESKNFIENATFTGSYLIRITGECDFAKTRWFEK